MANKIKENGSTIVYNNKAVKIHLKKNKITALETKKGVYMGNNFYLLDPYRNLRHFKQ